jgi:RimJ/RimL family protein N-acetyltransferase
MITLIDVYSAPEAARVLYDLLAEREPHQNISHKVMPTWEGHCKFVASKPYLAWYLIEINPSPTVTPPVNVGAVYLTRQREVGLFIFKAQRSNGYGKQALAELRLKHPGKLLANIAPENQRSQRFFQAQGFRHIQNTYTIEG